jgi:hypothetical protein
VGDTGEDEDEEEELEDAEVDQDDDGSEEMTGWCRGCCCTVRGLPYVCAVPLSASVQFVVHT